VPKYDGTALQLAMRERGFTVSSLARACDTTRATISRTRKGHTRPTRELCAKMAIALGKSIETMLSYWYDDVIQVLEPDRETRLDAEIAHLTKQLKRKLAQKNGVPLSVYRNNNSMHRMGYIYVTDEELAQLAEQVATREPFTDCVNVAEYSLGEIEGGFVSKYEILRKKG
jgi:transcriptional regulator with XRE-family HTH domain